jgi:hypothetical protein
MRRLSVARGRWSTVAATALSDTGRAARPQRASPCRVRGVSGIRAWWGGRGARRPRAPRLWGVGSESDLCRATRVSGSPHQGPAPGHRER